MMEKVTYSLYVESHGLSFPQSIHESNINDLSV